MNQRIRFVHESEPRMPDLFEWIADNAAASVGQTRIFPAQHDRDFSGEILLGAVNAGDVHHPYSGGNLSWSGTGRWPINQSGRFRAPRDLARDRKQNEKSEKNSLHASLPGGG